MKARLKKYLAITKKEWNGLVVLIILIAFVLLAPNVYQLFCKDNTINIKKFHKELALLSRNANNRAVLRLNEQSTNDRHFQGLTLNPNDMSLSQWEQLGLNDVQVKNIVKYRKDVGLFYNIADLKRVPGISDSDYNKVEPYIYLPQNEFKIHKISIGEVVEINAADSAKLTTIRGIGPSFAIRIFRYKSLLGGFLNKEQLMDIQGIDSIKFNQIKAQIKVNPDLVHKIDINAISFNQLRLFPYLGYKLDNAIIEYRNQHGKYTSINDFKKIAIMNDVILRKIEPYLIFK